MLGLSPCFVVGDHPPTRRRGAWVVLAEGVGDDPEALRQERFRFLVSALGDEAALVMGSFPKSRPKRPFPNFTEVMTGFEYTAGIGMLYEGMENEGLETIKNIRDRYDGLKRNPFDEAECGHHYARAMASWAGIIAESEFQYSAVDKSIKFTDKPGNYFWSTGSSWGMCEISKNDSEYDLSFEVLHGKLELDKFQIGENYINSFKSTERIQENENLEFSFQLK